MTEVVVTTGATRRAKLQSNRHTNIQLFYRPDAVPVTQLLQKQISYGSDCKSDKTLKRPNAVASQSSIRHVTITHVVGLQYSLIGSAAIRESLPKDEWASSRRPLLAF